MRLRATATFGQTAVQGQKGAEAMTRNGFEFPTLVVTNVPNVNNLSISVFLSETLIPSRTRR
ncbi:hypothetical protein M378DRAFT_165970, partial [Amanita muscaria Koide BX008]